MLKKNDDKINYEQIMRKALFSVVKNILNQVAIYGFFQDQHLFVTFDMRHQGIVVSQMLRENFEDELTIVLEHEFWDLIIDDYGFSVCLVFEHGEESLYIPFSSLISFQDPSEDFCLDFVPNFKDMPIIKDVAEIKSNIVSINDLRKGKN